MTPPPITTAPAAPGTSRNSSCTNTDGREWRCGQDATFALIYLIGDHWITCKSGTVGHSGGELGWVFKREQAMAQLVKEKKRAEQYGKLVTGRELRMIELKKEVDELLERLGEEPRYN